ncbi:hypothetical protein JEQ12_004465 [Ovis aries]|uniref:Uncharacterized protein n=1 Tax=Ovis aries TaxID=9940 RepID=A0A836A5R3_SHEEP|nr:hypothetical protein JEQ12_004465 [Ovis aries]
MSEELANLKGSWVASPQGPKKPVWVGEKGTLYAPKMRYRIAAVSVLQLCLQVTDSKLIPTRAKNGRSKPGVRPGFSCAGPGRQLGDLWLFPEERKDAPPSNKRLAT